MTGIDIKPDAQGKVRDLYDLGDKLLLVATDRISAFDYILEDEIPHKGAVLTPVSYTHLDVYKRQSGLVRVRRPAASVLAPYRGSSLKPSIIMGNILLEQE